MPDVLRTIQLLVAPVVMISACGLLCLALYNRLAAIVTRARIFDKERFDQLSQLALAETEPRSATLVPQLRHRVEVLDEQVAQILRRARLVRNALFCLLSAVVGMLVCSLALGLSLVQRWFAGLALWVFIVGTMVMLAGVVLALFELRHALHQVFREHRAIEGDQPAGRA